MPDFSIFSPYANLPGDPCNWIHEPPVLSGLVGWQQPNHPKDVLLIQRVINIVIDDGYLEPQSLTRVQEHGSWDESLDEALGKIEARYLSGMADSSGKRTLDNGSPLFLFLVQLAGANANLNTQYPSLMYPLAHVMLPGATAARNLSIYLSYILRALALNGLADTQMVLMALATIRAEAADAAPVSERISLFNSSPSALHHAPGSHAFDLYDNRTDLGNSGYPDGPNFRGRGFIQLTGRANYTKYANSFHWPLIEKPDTANDPWVAAMLLSRFLKNHELTIRNALHRGDMRTARRAVNGGSHGIAHFRQAMLVGRAFLQRHLGDDIVTHIAALATAGGK